MEDFMKKIIFLILAFIIIFLIYIKFKAKPIYFVSIGNQTITNLKNKSISYNNSFIKDNYLIKELTSDIYNNNYNLKKELGDSNILLLSIGINEIIQIVNNSNNSLDIYKSIDSIINDYKILILQIKKYARGKIIVVGLYDNKVNNNYLKYFNSSLNKLMEIEKIDFINFNQYLNKKDLVKENIINEFLDVTT